MAVRLPAHLSPRKPPGHQEKPLRLFKKNYFELDLVRAVAILLVVFFHLNQKVFHLPDTSYLGLFFNWGWHGVDLFFVLSGFLIGGQIIEDNFEGRFTFKRFYLKRVLRTFPPYYFYYFLVTAIYSYMIGEFALRNTTILKDLLLHLSYLNNYIEVIKRQSGLYWSLAIEEQFYLITPLIMFLLIRHARRYVLPALVTLISIGVIIRLALYEPALGAERWWHGFYVPFHTRFDELLFGVATAYIFITFKERLERLPGIWKALMLVISALSIGASYLYGKMGAGYFNTCWQFTVTGLGFAILILYITTFPIERFVPLKWAFRGTARLSYTMYIYHIVVLNLFLAFLARRGIAFNTNSPALFALLVLIYFAGLFLVSGFFFTLVEMPFMRLRRKIRR